MYGYRRHWDLPVILLGYARKITGTGPAVRIILHSRQRGCVNHKTLRGGRDSYRLPHFPAFTTNHGEPETGNRFAAGTSEETAKMKNRFGRPAGVHRDCPTLPKQR